MTIAAPNTSQPMKAVAPRAERLVRAGLIEADSEGFSLTSPRFAGPEGAPRAWPKGRKAGSDLAWLSAPGSGSHCQTAPRAL